jgi:hypothetical protein
VKFDGVLFRNYKCVASGERLDVQEGITCSLATWVLSTEYLFAVSRILKDGISPLMMRQKIQADDIMASDSRGESGGLETGVRKLGPC